MRPDCPSLRLVQFSDPHLYGDVAGELRGIATLPAFRAAIAHSERHFPARDAILLTGDLVQEDPGGYVVLRDTLAGSTAPIYCLPGNHDLPDEMSRVLRGAPFQVGGYVESGAWLIVLLNTWAPDMAGGRLGAEQLATLDDLLTLQSERHALLCLHHHPIAMQSRWLDRVGLEDAEAFRALIARHANVRGVLCGHVHQALDRFVDGVRFMASPATCAQFLPRSDDFALDRRPPGYRVLELMPDGAIATEVVWVEAA